MIERISHSTNDAPKAHIARRIVLNILTDVPPFELLGRIWQLSCLATVDRFACDFGLRSRANILLRTFGGRVRGLTDEMTIVRQSAIRRSQPSHLPENQTTSLASTMRRAIATRFQMNGIVDPSTANREHGVAGLMRSFVNLESFATKSKHLGHEWHTVELTVTVEGS